jgi:Protein of unknown function (DUF2490)
VPSPKTSRSHDEVRRAGRVEHNIGVRRPCLALLIWLLTTAGSAAQDSTLEFWPEVDVWWRVSPAWRLSLFVPISQNIETAYREGNLILQGDYAWGRSHHLRRRRLLDENRAQNMKALLVRGGYLGGKSLGDNGDAYTERTAFTELHVRVPIKGGILLQQRLRNDLRWLGNPADFSQRWRYRTQVEKDYQAGRTSIVPYVNAEAYYDSRYDTVNRIRAISGASVSWSSRLAVEGNLTYQYDSRSSTTHLLALNLILHVFFETGGGRPPSSPSRGHDATQAEFPESPMHAGGVITPRRPSGSTHTP